MSRCTGCCGECVHGSGACVLRGVMNVRMQCAFYPVTAPKGKLWNCSVRLVLALTIGPAFGFSALPGNGHPCPACLSSFLAGTIWRLTRFFMGQICTFLGINSVIWRLMPDWCFRTVRFATCILIYDSLAGWFVSFVALTFRYAL